ncbi:MAG: response regulator [Flavisolibacter sp.]
MNSLPKKTGKPVITSIILADDDEDDRYIFNQIVQEVNEKVKLEFVSNGIQLISLLQNFYPDLLFLDLDMPYKNGLECLIEIRSNPRLKDLPVIVFSSTTRQANIQTAYEMGAHLFLIKSSDIKEYTLAIKSILALNWDEPNKVKDQYSVNGRYTAFG